jgi:hypothetical protein
MIGGRAGVARRLQRTQETSIIRSLLVGCHGRISRRIPLATQYVSPNDVYPEAELRVRFENLMEIADMRNRRALASRRGIAAFYPFLIGQLSLALRRRGFRAPHPFPGGCSVTPQLPSRT